MSVIMLGVVVGLVVTFCAIVVNQPDEFRVTRSAVINASPAMVFEYINNLQKWNAWSPWAKLDPNTQNSFEGPQGGVEAIMRWSGNNKVGQGSMTILESRQNDFIKFQLDFLKPMKATNIAEFAFKQEANQTNVTWTMYGKSNLMGKVMGLIFNCEKMVGGQFEQGLTNLKSIVE